MRLSTYRSAEIVRAWITELGIRGVDDMERLVLHSRKNPVPGLEEDHVRWYGEDIVKGEWPHPPRYDEAELRSAFASQARRAAVGTVSEDPVDDALASKLYGRPALPPDVEWPLSEEGEPMIFLGQFNFERIGVTPDTMNGVALLSVFVHDLDEMYVWENEPFFIAHASLEGLEARAVPEGAEGNPERSLSFEIVEDYPALDDPCLRIPEGADREQIWRTNIPDVLEDMSCKQGLKIGGYAYSIQTNYALSSLDDVRERTDLNLFVLQISTDDMHIDVGDFGVLYVGFDPTGSKASSWFAQFDMG